MKPISIVIAAMIIAIASFTVYSSQEHYKFSCVSEPDCYPCTRWMDCVSEDFYLQNTDRCRIGAEENLSRISCKCQAGSCGASEIKPFVPSKSNVWTPEQD